MKKRFARHIMIGLAAAEITAAGGLRLEACGTAPTVEPEIVSPLSQGFVRRAAAMIPECNYKGASDQLDAVDPALLDSSARQAMEFERARISFMAGDPACVALLDRYVASYPASPHTLEAMLLAADYYFYAHDFPAALRRYESADLAALAGADRKEYSFRKALAMTRCGYYREARPLFLELEGTSELGTAACYYVAYIDYVLGDYQEAERRFLTIPDTGTPGASRRRGDSYVSDGLEPGYYLTQISYLRQDYDDVIRHGRSLLSKRPVDELRPETLRVIGESYFKTGHKDTAAEFLQLYMEEAPDSAEPTARYALATVYYDRGEYEKAASLFSTLTDLNNVLSQSAWLYIGECDARRGDDRAAAIAFDRAYRLRHSDSISETALYNYATALMRGGSVPFSDAAASLERFLASYPRSTYAPKVRAILGSAYSRQGDYAKALGFLDKIASPDRRTLALRQKTLFELGRSELANSDYAAAESHLSSCVEIGDVDPALAREARLWLGDAFYARKNYSGAERQYSDYLKGASKDDPNRALAVYNLAYALYQQDKFAQAAPLFARAAESAGLGASRRDNARLRQADCLFYSRDYAEARKVYASLISSGAPGADYASLRHATISGLLGDVSGKLKELEALARKYPGTAFDAAAMLERGNTLAQAGRREEARKVYGDMAGNMADRPEAREAMLRLASTYSDDRQPEKAASTLRSLIEKWPASPEAAAAADRLATYYASEGTLPDFSRWLDSINGAPRLSSDEMESRAYDAAAEAFAENSPRAVELLRLFADSYPDSPQLAKALLSLAQALEARRHYEEALDAAERLLSSRPDAPQTSEALLLAADIAENHLSGNNPRRLAYNFYSELARKGNSAFTPSALAGMMRTTDSDAERLRLARKILASGADTGLMEQASYYEGSSLLLSDPKSGIAVLGKLAANPQSLYGAMAAVALGQHYLDTKQYAAGEKVLSAFTDSGSPHDYWIARGFILLADIYSAQGRKSLAKEYLLSLRDNYPGEEPDIISMISTRLDKLSK